MVLSNKSLCSKDLTRSTSEGSIRNLTDKGDELRRRYYEQRLTNDDGSLEEWMSIAMLEYGDIMGLKDEGRKKAGFELWGDTFIGEKKVRLDYIYLNWYIANDYSRGSQCQTRE